MKNNTLYTLNEMLEYGPIVASDAELGIYVTANGSYLNLWVGCAERGFDGVDCKSFSLDGNKSIMDMPMRWVVEKAEEWIQEGLKEQDEAVGE